MSLSYSLRPVSEPAVLGELQGLTIANNGTDATNDIDFAAGRAVLQNTSGVLRAVVFESAITKRLDAAWAAGTGNGGLDTGSVANTTYHCFRIWNPSTGVKDALFSASLSPSLPSGFEYFRRVGSFTRAAAANRAFVQLGKYFQFPTRIRALDGYSVSTSGELITMPVPSGIKVRVKGILNPGAPPVAPASNSNWLSILLLDGDLSGTVSANSGTAEFAAFDGTASTRDRRGTDTSQSAFINSTATLELCVTNSSGQLYFRRSGSYLDATFQTTFQVHGYEDFSL